MKLEGLNPAFDPRPEIEAIRAMILAGGRVDSEHGELDKIIRSWEGKEISAEEAVNQARAIEASRQEGML